MRAAILAASGLLLAAAWAVSRQAQAASAAGEDVGAAGSEWETGGGDWLANADNVLQDAAANIAGTIEGFLPVGWGLGMWSEDKIPEQYRAAIAAAESRNGIPRMMLARLLWQESRFRPDIIEGRTVSSTGAQGIAQFMPATAAEMGIDPLDAFAAIAGAGRYLRRMYDSLGSWPQALAAYNWGIGNVRRKGLAAAPRETRNYYAQILADLGMGVVVA